jgi:flagellar biosynthesis protein FlhA
MFLFALIPGLPHFAFLLLSGATFLAGKMAREKAQVVEEMATLPEVEGGEDAADLASAEGDRPIKMIWDLAHPMPAELYEKARTV